MQGSWDNPPIVISYPVWKAWLGLFGSIALGVFAVIGVLPSNPLLGLALATAAGFGVWSFRILLHHSVSLQLSPQGVSWDGGDKTIAWPDLEKVHYVHIRANNWVQYYLNSTRQTREKGIKDLFDISDGELPNNLEVSGQDLVDLINEAKARWAPRQ